MYRIKELRLERNQNMRQTAIELDIPYTTYISYEKGDREPNSETLIILADYFNCSIDYLIGRSNIRIDDSILDKVNEIDSEILEKHGNIYATNRAILEGEIIKKYRTLDEHGKKIVDFILEEEYKRCISDEQSTVLIKHSVYKVSAGRGFDLDDRDEWEEIEILDTPEAQKADFAVTIKGNSMEPLYYDGDIVLVKSQPAVDLGETGIYIINGSGFIKRYGGDRLISVNSDYDDIMFSENDRISCAGKVIGSIKAS